MLNVTERKTSKQGIATKLEDGRYSIDFGNGEPKVLAESTFKRLYTINGETTVETPIQDEVASTTEETTVETPVDETPKEDERAELDAELNALLGDADEVSEEDTLTPVDESKPNKPEKPEVPQRSVADLGLNIELLSWDMEGTRGGKTDKVISSIRIKEYIMEITEYAGFITDVRLFEEVEAPENDPDAALKLAYKSPKMSLKDTLEWLGLNADDMKLARKEITAIRKDVKSAHLEQLEEQKEQEEMEKATSEEQEVNA